MSDAHEKTKKPFRCIRADLLNARTYNFYSDPERNWSYGARRGGRIIALLINLPGETISPSFDAPRRFPSGRFCLLHRPVRTATITWREKKMKIEKIVLSTIAYCRRLKSFCTSGARVLTTLTLVGAATTGAAAQTFNTLHSFNGSDGANPRALVQATNGYLYGNTVAGGTTGNGTVFQITTSGTLKPLHSFDGQDGSEPNRLVQATNGYLYGTTNGGNGTVFQITTSGTLKTLVGFNGADGYEPDAGLLQATDGNLYGTTVYGGTHGDGTVFKITPSGALKTLHSFDGADGSEPKSGLLQAADGNLYGTTVGGGTNSNGTVFQITTSGTLKTLVNFNGADGSAPYAALVQATDGNFYGTTEAGGLHGYGTVFKITSSGTLMTLHSFCAVLVNGHCSDGAYPYYTPLVQATNGYLYGTTEAGGTDGDGTVFQITTSGTLKTLHSFDGMDGSELYAGLVQDTNGEFYGTTSTGGTHGLGTVFSLEVAGLGPFVQTQTTSGKEGAEAGILGQGFSSSSVVKFGGTQATIKMLAGTTFITATVPAEALTGAVTVTTGTTTLTSPKTFDVLPTITSFIPESGPVGTSVTFKGTGLKQTTKVTFEGKSATFTPISDTEVKAEVPTGAASGKIAVTTKGGSATTSASFTVN